MDLFFSHYYMPVTKAAGILIYKTENKKIHFLLRQSGGRGFSDFGGKREPIDMSPEDTAVRECFEETNGVFNKEFLYGMAGISIYIPQAKYRMYLMEITVSIDPVKVR